MSFKFVQDMKKQDILKFSYVVFQGLYFEHILKIGKYNRYKIKC